MKYSLFFPNDDWMNDSLILKRFYSKLWTQKSSQLIVYLENWKQESDWYKNKVLDHPIQSGFFYSATLCFYIRIVDHSNAVVTID